MTGPTESPSIAALDDETLELQAVEGNHDAFGELYDRHFDRVYDFAFRMVRDPDEAADVAQETFIRAMGALKRGKERASFKTWVFKIARNLSLTKLQKSRRSTRFSDPDSPEEAEDEGRPVLHLSDPSRASDPVSTAQQSELSKLVWDAAELLNPRESSILDLHLRQGLDSAEIAETLGISKGNAYTIVSRLKDTFEDAVAALVLITAGRKKCAELDALLASRSGPLMTASARRDVMKHAAGCPTCESERKKLLSPSVLFGGFAMIPAPVGLKPSIAGVLQSQWHIVGPGAASSGSAFLQAASWIVDKILFIPRLVARWITQHASDIPAGWRYQTVAWKGAHVGAGIFTASVVSLTGLVAADAFGGGPVEPPVAPTPSPEQNESAVPVCQETLTHVVGEEGLIVDLPCSVPGGSDSELRCEIVGPPENGDATVDGCTLTYRPDPGYSGGDSVAYRAQLGEATGDDAQVILTVSSTVNAAPVCGAVQTEGGRGQASTIDADCVDLDGPDELTCEFSAPAHGSIETSGCSVKYIPDGGFSGTDTFGVRAFDGRNWGEQAMVTVFVTGAAAPAPTGGTTDPTTAPTPLSQTCPDDPTGTAVAAESLAVSLVQRTNSYRAALALPVLTPNSALDAAARQHARFIVENEWFKVGSDIHLDANGCDHIDRTTALGYPSTYVGENGAFAWTTGGSPEDQLWCALMGGLVGDACCPASDAGCAREDPADANYLHLAVACYSRTDITLGLSHYACVQLLGG